MLSKTQIYQDVLATLSVFSKIPVEDFEDDWVLQKRPLRFDGHGLKFLTMSLRGYVRFHSSETIRVSEVSKSGVDVKGLISLVQKKLA